MKLFLTSAGLPAETTNEFLEMLSKKPKDTAVCFIATASEPEQDKWFVEKDKERLLELGFRITEIDLKQENEKSLRNILEKFDVVYVEGGNTFYLLKYIRESGFDKAMLSFLKKGKIYVGVSAGSIVAGPNIELAGWKNVDKNIIGLKNLTGLNLVPFAIFPHFEKSYLEILEKFTSKIDYPVVALSDAQAVLVKNKVYKIIGKGERHIFNTRDIKFL